MADSKQLRKEQIEDYIADAVQAVLDAKLNLSGGTLTGDLLVGNMTLSSVTGGGRIEGSLGGAFNVTDIVYTSSISTTGNITITGTVDGRDVATDGTKLDGIEAAADVTDTANVTSAGAVMDSEVTNLAQVKAFDSTDYATAAQGTTADSALQPSDIASGTITARADDIDFSGGADGDVLTVQADGSLAPETPAGGGGGDVTAASNFGTDNILIRSDGTTKGVQSSGITIADNDFMSSPASIQTSGAIITDTVSELTGAAGVTIDGVNLKDGEVDGVDLADVVQGAASATNNAIARYDATTGKLLQDSEVTIDDNGNMTVGDGSQTSVTISFNNSGSAFGAGISMDTSNNLALSSTATGVVKLPADATTSDPYLSVEKYTGFSVEGVRIYGDLIQTDTVDEFTAAAGVTIDGVLLKDGEVDGRDVATDGTKLDGIETGATANSDTSIINLVYPVGSYYINETNSTNPGTLFGVGTWVAVANKMIVGKGSGTFATAGSTGGAETTTIAQANLPNISF